MIKRATLFILAIIAYLPLASLFSSDAYAYAYKANHVSFNTTTKALSFDIEGTLPWSGTQSVYFALDSGAAVNWSHTIAGETVSTNCNNWTHCDVTIDEYSDFDYNLNALMIVYMWKEGYGAQLSQPFYIASSGYKASNVSFNLTTKALSFDINGTVPWSGTQSVWFALDSGPNWSYTIAGETVSTNCNNWTHCDVTIDEYSDHTYDPDAEMITYMWTEPTGAQLSQPFYVIPDGPEIKATNISFDPDTKNLTFDYNNLNGTLPFSGTQNIYFAVLQGPNWSYTIAGETVSTNCNNWTHCDVTIDEYSDHTYDPDAETVIYMWTEPTGAQLSQPFTL